MSVQVLLQHCCLERPGFGEWLWQPHFFVGADSAFRRVRFAKEPVPNRNLLGRLKGINAVLIGFIDSEDWTMFWVAVTCDVVFIFNLQCLCLPTKEMGMNTQQPQQRDCAKLLCPQISIVNKLVHWQRAWPNLGREVTSQLKIPTFAESYKIQVGVS